MHRFLAVLLIALFVPGLAHAQTQPPGPFRLGMSADEVRAALPSATWEQREMGSDALALMTRTPVYIGDSAFFPMLMLTGGEVYNVTFGRPAITADAAACSAEAVRTVLALEGEAPFAGGRTNDEPDSTPTETRTTGGSIVRAYPPAENGVVMTHAVRAGEPAVEIASIFGMRAEEGDLPAGACMVALQFGSDPPPPPVLPVNVPTPEELAAAELITGARFIEMPDGRDYARWYPTEAMNSGIEGRVVLNCIIGPDGYLRCAIESEEPAGAGFGAASQQIALRFRVAPDAEGVPTVGRRVRRTIVWRLG